MAWLHVIAPRYRTDQPTAHSWCACGRDETAVGVRQVQALIAAHADHRTACPLRTASTTSTEGRPDCEHHARGRRRAA
ncbi:hypothetical protein CK485_27730 [Streptomyces sp. ICBB 8177]|nr:hypothetical protein CK485_27730 [Streptomyces sp. ICBB 8177]